MASWEGVLPQRPSLGEKEARVAISAKCIGISSQNGFTVEEKRTRNNPSTQNCPQPNRTPAFESVSLQSCTVQGFFIPWAPKDVPTSVSLRCKARRGSDRQTVSTKLATLNLSIQMSFPCSVRLTSFPSRHLEKSSSAPSCHFTFSRNSFFTLPRVAVTREDDAGKDTFFFLLSA